MSDNMQRYESMLLQGDTTMRTEYKEIDLKSYEKTKYVTKPPCQRLRPPPLKDINAMTNWKVPNVPFTLFWKPKGIIRTHPLDLQKSYHHRSQDDQTENVRKTRPRVVMTPACSLDDIDDERREILLNQTYNTTAHIAQEATRQLVTRGKVNVQAPLPLRYSPAKPITLRKLLPPYVSPEWRMDSVSWDGRQVRGSLCSKVLRRAYNVQ